MNRRQADILELLGDEKEVSIRDLAGRFGVTTVTIRRDLDGLQGQGRLMRTHGGAIPAMAGVVEFSFAAKERRHAAQKKAIARAVASLIAPGMRITLDTGTTTLEVARAVARVKDLTVLTTSLAVASALQPCENIELVLLGGTVRKSGPDLVGVLAERNLRSFRVDLAVLGADAAGTDGVFTTDMAVARVSQAMMSGAARKTLAVDSSKFAASALFKYAEWSEFDQLVTDERAPADVREWLGSSVRSVTYAESIGPRTPTVRLGKRAGK